MEKKTTVKTASKKVAVKKPEPKAESKRVVEKKPVAKPTPKAKKAPPKKVEDPEPVKFGKAIASIRMSKGISTVKLAELAQVDVRTIRRIEAGEVNTGLMTAIKIVDALGYRLDLMMK